jgi:hypothetical protein
MCSSVNLRVAKLIIPDATEMPLYKMINDPLRTVMGVENVNRNVKMADSELLLSA